MKYVGIDVHKTHCQAAVLDDEGELFDQIRFLNKKEEIKEFAMKLTTFRDDVKAVVESTGNLWIQIHDILENFGIDVVLSRARLRVETTRTYVHMATRHLAFGRRF